MRFACAVLALAIAGISSVSCQDKLWDFDSNAPNGNSVSVFKSLLELDGINSGLLTFFNTTGVNGTAFVPTDAAITSFLAAAKLEDSEFTARINFVNAVVMDHVILPSANMMGVMGSGESKNYESADGNMVAVTFNGDGEVTSVKPVNEAPVTYANTSSVIGKYGPITDDTFTANATIYFVDAVIVTKSTYDNYIGKGANTYYQAIEKVIAEMDGELSTFKAVVDMFPDVKALLEQDFPQMMNKTALFAPSNAAFENLLTDLGAGTTAEQLTATEGLKALVGTILQYHYSPEYISEVHHDSFSVGATFQTLLSVVDSPIIPDATLMTSQVDGNFVLTYGLTEGEKKTTNISSSMMDVKVITRGGFAKDESESHEGHLHIVNDVLLPIFNATKFNLADFNSADNRPSGKSYDTFGDVVAADVPELAFAKLALNGPALRGAMFVPSDDALNTFLNSSVLTADRLERNGDLARAVVYEHTIFDTVMNGTNTTYSTWDLPSSTGTGSVVASKDLSVTLDSDGYVMTIAAGGDTANVDGWYGRNANGLVANVVSGGGMENGYVYYIDKVLVSSAITDAVAARESPADDAWASQGPDGETFNTALEVLKSVPELNDLFSGEADFTMFMPSDAAFANLADERNVTVEVMKERLMGNQETLRTMLGSYIVMADEYSDNDCVDDRCQMENNVGYRTRADTYLQRTANGFRVSDDNQFSKKRSLLATEGGIEKCVAFFDGKSVCYVDTAALTATIESAANDVINSASSVAPSMALLVALVGALMALFL